MILDPHVQGLLDSFNKVLEPEIPEEESKGIPGLTLGEAIVEANRQAKAAETHKPEDKKPAAPDKPADTKPADQKPSDQKPEEPKAEEPRPIRLKRKVELSVTPAAQTPPQKPQDPDAAAKADEEYDKTLDPEQQDVMQLARYGEVSRPGIVKEMREFFRKVDTYLDQHPGTDSESEEYKEWVIQNQPKWSDTEKRRAEREMIASEVRKEVRKEFVPQVEQQKAQLHELNTRPAVEEAVSEVEAAIVSAKDGEGIPKEVVQRLREVGLAEASKEFKIEAPIVQGTINATRAWMDISLGRVQFDPNNPLHNWLSNFVDQEGRTTKALPKEQQVKNGKTFMPYGEYHIALQNDKTVASKHYTLTDEDICGGLVRNARQAYDNELKALEKAGFKRESKKVSTETGNSVPATPPGSTTPANTTAGSPRAGGRGIPGTTDGAPANGNASYLDKLFPGASKMIGA